MKILLNNPLMFTSILTNFSSLFNYSFFELCHANMPSQSPATRVKNPSQNIDSIEFMLSRCCSRTPVSQFAHQRYPTTLSTCADSNYIKDKLLPSVPAQILNTSKICCYLKNFLRQSLGRRYLTAFSTCADIHQLEDNLLS